MFKALLILIAERNAHIRNLIKRELNSEDYYAFTVENMPQLKNWMYMRRAPDILVLDPELPGLEKQNIWELLDFYPQTPVILYCLPGNEWLAVKDRERLTPVPKDGSSIAVIKERIRQMNHDDLSVEMIDL